MICVLGTEISPYVNGAELYRRGAACEGLMPATQGG